MSEADKMFEELEYKNIERDDRYIQYDSYNSMIIFDKEFKTVSKWDFSENREDITLSELKAINTKVKELGWE